MKKFKLIIYLCTVIALGLVVLDIVIDFDSSIMKWIYFVLAGGFFQGFLSVAEAIVLMTKNNCCPYLTTLLSGSPVLPNGRLIGAITHVLVDDPTTGYAIFAENMLETAQSVANSEKLRDAS